MKKNLINLLSIAAVTAFLSSCSSYTHTYRLSEVPDRDISIAEKNVVDIQPDFTKQVHAESGKHSSPKAAREEAYYRAIMENNIHVLIDPIYSVRTSARILIFGGKSKASVTGFAGYYTNPRSASKAKADANKAELEAAKLESEIFDQKLKDLEKFSKIAILGQEQTETYMIDTKGSNCCTGNDGKSAVATNGQLGQVLLLNKAINKPSLIDQYEKFLNVIDGKGNTTSTELGTNNTQSVSDEVEVKRTLGQKIRGFFASIPLIGRLFR